MSGSCRHHRREVGAAAEPRLGGDDEAGVHVHRRHLGRAHVRHQRDARGMEARVLVGAGNLLAELRAELAVHGRDVDADLLEHPAAHDRHHAAAAILARLAALALPGLALEAAGRQVAVRAGELGLDLLELGADAVAQGFEPGARSSGVCVWIEVGHAEGVMGYPSVWRRASLNTIAAASATLSERTPVCIGTRTRSVGRLVDLGGHAGAFAAQQQDVVGSKPHVRQAGGAGGGEQHQPAGRRSRRNASQRGVARGSAPGRHSPWPRAGCAGRRPESRRAR